MKKKRTAAIVMTALLALCMCVPAFAEDIDSAGNVFESGETVSLPSVPFFGGFIAGRTVGVAGSEAKGSVMAAGQDVNVSGSSVGESLHVAGNNVTVSLTAVEGNLWAAATTSRSAKEHPPTVFTQQEPRSIIREHQTVSLQPVQTLSLPVP